jgi:hypothetical protein
LTRSLAPALGLGALLLLPAAGHAQRALDPDQADLPVDATTREQVVEAVIKALNEAYVFPEKARKVEERLREDLKGGKLDDVTTSKALVKALNERFEAICKDKHLHVFYDAHGLPPEPKAKDEKPSPERLAKMRAYGDSINWGFEKVERLPGNVGYLDLRGFAPAGLGGETAAAAMNFVANADALIIDVRQNGGGDPSMVALVCSYLFDPEPVHLNDLYDRPEDSTHQWWTLPYVPGKRFVGKDVYVLTSGRTFSAAEEFTYNLKNLKRATIVGETTGGGAHPGGVRRLDDHFAMFVPSGRAISPITKTNWEGTGVAPDVAVAADLALKAAHLAALEKIVAKASGESDDPRQAMRQKQLKQEVERLRKELDDAKAKSKKDDGATAKAP